MEEEKEFYFKTQNLSVGYNRKPILENISLGVYKGQILTLIGPNGSGKSTILKNLFRQYQEPPRSQVIHRQFVRPQA